MIQPNSRQDSQFAHRLLAWYDKHHRDLPWRTTSSARARGAKPDPYRVWLSEIMLQQTTVEAVKPYFRNFVARWPDVTSLATAETDEIMKAWAGLGYYSRARNLKKCADQVAAEHGGRFPEDEAGLRELPGIGQYTAAAIAAIAFDRPAAVVDGNVERVIARHAAIETPLPEAKTEIRGVVAERTPVVRPGDFAQAMMDLGATICTPKRPACMVCPVSGDCEALSAGDPEFYPLRAPKADRPDRKGAAFVAVRADGSILVRKRPETGLLGGMTEVPTSAWTARVDGDTTPAAAPFAADWKRAGSIAHVFTHFALDLTVYRADVADIAIPSAHRWVAAEDIRGEAFPTVIKKAIEVAIPGATRRIARQGQT